MLPPIIYTPPPKPKKIENRKSRIQLRSTGIIRNSGEIDETEETSGLDRPTPVAYKPSTDTETAIKGSERKPKSTTGLLEPLAGLQMRAVTHKRLHLPQRHIDCRAKRKCKMTDSQPALKGLIEYGREHGIQLAGSSGLKLGYRRDLQP